MLKIFGTEHIIFLVIFFVFAIISWVLIKKYAKNEKTKSIIVRCIGALLFLFVLWNRIELIIKNGQFYRILPNSFCGLNSFVLGLAVLFGRKNNSVLHYVCYVAFVGGLITILYPDFITSYDTFMHPIVWSGLLHHALSFYLCVLVQLVGWFTPTYKKWKNIIIGFLAYITFGTFLIYVIGYSTAFYINKPAVSGIPSTIWVIFPVFAVGYALYISAVEIIRRKRKNKKVDVHKIIMRVIKTPI